MSQTVAELDTADAADGGTEHIVVRGARVHNLQNVSLDIPRDQLVVITGPSGSGKSSLAFDTLFAEGQRQYIESLSVYARQFLNQLERPDVDLIEGLQPTISIDQRAGSQNPRSTVATVTEIYDYLRLLYARLGRPYCYQCQSPIEQQSAEQILDALTRLPEGAKVMLMAPLVRGRKGKHLDVLEQVRKAGLVRVRIDGEVYDLDSVPELAPRKNHTVEAIVDRIIIRDKIRARLAESILAALKLTDGLLTITWLAPDDDPAGPWRDRLFSTRSACAECGQSFPDLEPRSFSFNSPYGACPECEGLGHREAFDPELVMPDRSKSLAAGAVAPWGRLAKWKGRAKRELTAFLEQNNLTPAAALDTLKPKLTQTLWEGDGRQFVGLSNLLEDAFAEADDAERQRLEAFRGSVPCPVCGGSRLRAESRSVRLGGFGIHELAALTPPAVRQQLAGLTFDGDERLVADPLLDEIGRRLEFLQHVGLDYLSLDRPADTLSGGELQRIRLATSIGSGLVGVCYILDEPSIGLHPRDNQRLIESLRNLQQQGNTLLVVEHDEAIMRAADWLIDIGPGAGLQGGRIVAEGTPAELCHHGESVTGQYLSGARRIARPQQRRAISRKRMLVLEGASANNLKNITVEFPLGALVCVTGVSGSGKSTLLNETLAPAMRRRLHGDGPRPGAFTGLRGVQQIDKLVQVDQSPIGRTPRSNPATYTGVFDEVRKVFATTREARGRGYKSGRFSFNTKGGRCEACQGQGLQKIEMNFLPDLYVECAECHGQRFNRQTLEVKYRDHSIADVLAMRVDEAATFFENYPLLARVLNCLQDVGLGYLTLGQSCTTLSGGEAQRIKLATELSRTTTGRTLYLLDEPTTGLHFEDIERLLQVLGQLVDLGNTVIVIEHNLDVMQAADWLIDLGPEGGAAGGYLTAAGPPEELAALADNATGRFLRAALERG